jgi:hypothetical protein
MWALGCAVIAAALPSGSGAPRNEPCETSAAVALQDGRILVGDNETKDRLFAYVWHEGGARPAEPFEITWDPSGGRKVEDIEALARDGSRIYVVGSHSRKKNCERDEERFRILRGRIEGDMLVDTVVMGLAAARSDAAWMQATGDVAGCLERLFTEDARRSRLAHGFCEALVEAERAANWGGNPSRAGAPPGGGVAAHCQRTLNIEGAAVIAGRLWIGLRAPLVGKERRAALLRVRDENSTYRFDAVALVGLDGRGIRELETLEHGGRVRLWGIAGPVEDTAPGNARAGLAGASTGFVLWSADASQMQPEALLDPTSNGGLQQVPASSEGLVLRPPQALLWIDGNGKYPADCKQPHQTAVIPLW